jgi:hypothetical protein
MGHGSCLPEEVIRDGFISGRNSPSRVGLLLFWSDGPIRRSKYLCRYLD